MIEELSQLHERTHKLGIFLDSEEPLPPKSREDLEEQFDLMVSLKEVLSRRIARAFGND